MKFDTYERLYSVMTDAEKEKIQSQLFSSTIQLQRLSVHIRCLFENSEDRKISFVEKIELLNVISILNKLNPVFDSLPSINDEEFFELETLTFQQDICPKFICERVKVLTLALDDSAKIILDTNRDSIFYRIVKEVSKELYNNFYVNLKNCIDNHKNDILNDDLKEDLQNDAGEALESTPPRIKMFG